MIKRIVVLLLLFISLFLNTAFANDGGSIIDNKNYLDIKVTPKSEEAQIGSLFEVEAIFTNNTSDDITLLYISNFFGNTPLTSAEYTTDLYDSMNIVIEPGKQAVVELSVIVPEIVSWYTEDSQYYFDIDLQVEYNATTKDFGLWSYRNDNFDPIKIKLTNIVDGTDILGLSLVEDESVILFMDDCASNSRAYKGELPAVIHNRVIFENRGDTPIDYLYIKDYDRFNWNSIRKPVSFAVDGTLIRDIANSYYLTRDEIKKQLTAEYQGTFRIGDNYYGVQLDKQFDTDVIEFPKVEFTFIADGTVDVKNISGKDYENIYIDFDGDVNELIKGKQYNGEHTLETFANNDTVNLTRPLNVDSNHYTFGYIINDTLYFWVVYASSDKIDDKPEEFTFSTEDEFGRIELIQNQDIQVGETPKQTVEPTPIPTPTEKPTATSSIAPSEKPTPTPIIKPSLAPTNTPDTITKAPVSTDKNGLVNVDSVEVSSSLPIFVLLILGTAIIYSGTLIYILRKNRKFKE